QSESLASRARELETGLLQAGMDKESLSSELSGLRGQQQCSALRADNLAVENAKLLTSMAALTSDAEKTRDGAASHVDELVASLETMKAGAAAQTAQIDQLQAALLTASGDCSTARAQLEARATELEAGLAREAALRAELDQVQRAVEEMRTENSNLAQGSK